MTLNKTIHEFILGLGFKINFQTRPNLFIFILDEGHLYLLACKLL